MARGNRNFRGGRRGGQGGQDRSRSRGAPGRPDQAEASPLVGLGVEFAIDALALGGAGVGRLPETLEGLAENPFAGMAVFVAGALPGSRVRARITAAHRRHAEAVAEAVLSPSPDAVAPFCPHAGVCGGCPLQGLAPAVQLAWKQRQIVEALARIGKVTPNSVLPAVPAPSQRHFRNKMEFAFQGAGDGLRLGLYEAREPGRVFDLAACPVFPEAGAQIVDAVRAACRKAGMAAFERGRGQGLLRHLVLRHSVFEDALLAQLITAPADEAQARAVQELGQALLDSAPKLAGFVHAERGRADGLAQAERTRLTLGRTTLTESLAGVRYAISADAFFQTSTGGALALYSALRELLDLAPADTVFDLFSGGGGIALFLASSVGRVLGLEQNPAAVADAEANAKLNGAANCRFLRAELSGPSPMPEKLPRNFERADVIIVDPPRDGLDTGLAAWLADNPAPRLGYVSCNPATLARDAGLLARTYDLAAVRCVDLFPHTAHAESVALFTPRA